MEVWRTLCCVYYILPYYYSIFKVPIMACMHQSRNLFTITPIEGYWVVTSDVSAGKQKLIMLPMRNIALIKIRR